MRNIKFMPNKYYHLCGRGADYQKIFCDDEDFAKFMFLLLHFQSPTPINNTGYYTRSFLKTGSFRVGDKKMQEIMETRYLEVSSFVLTPNYFHILIKNLEEGVVSVYMHRVLTSYSKYFNAKYKRAGRVFDGPFEASLVKNKEQLLNTSAYIHKNLIEFDNEAVVDYEKYRWSSCGDFINTNRWGDLLSTDIIFKQFKNNSQYKNFLSTSKAKEPLF